MAVLVVAAVVEIVVAERFVVEQKVVYMAVLPPVVAMTMLAQFGAVETVELVELIVILLLR